jgi:hypothetical protein
MPGGAGSARAPALGDERGSQTLELALALPFIVLGVAVLLQAAVLGGDLVAAHSVAFQAARTAAVADDATVDAAVREAAGRRPVQVVLDPPSTTRRAGDLVAATVRLRSSAFAAFGPSIWLPAKVTLRVERP